MRSMSKIVWFERGDPTFRDIYQEFLLLSDYTRDDVLDYRPCHPPYYKVYIPQAIVVWTKKDGRIIWVRPSE